MKLQGWRKIASATWGRPTDPQIYGDLEVDATRLLAFVHDVRRVTGIHVRRELPKTRLGKIDFSALLESEPDRGVHRR